MQKSFRIGGLLGAVSMDIGRGGHGDAVALLDFHTWYW